MTIKLNIVLNICNVVYMYVQSYEYMRTYMYKCTYIDNYALSIHNNTHFSNLIKRKLEIIMAYSANKTHNNNFVQSHTNVP